MTRFNIHQVEIIRSGLDHPECINFGRDGALYAGGFAGQVYRMSPPKFELKQLADTKGFVGGVAADGNDNVYACNATRHSVLRLTSGGVESVFCERAPDGPLIMPNYGSFDKAGNYYVSDSGDYWTPNGRLIRVRPNGTVESVIGSNWHYPNGLAISPRDGAVYMIESTAADILRIPVQGDGKCGMPEIYAQLQGNVLDGLAFAANGNLYCSCYHPNRIYVIHPDRNVELLIEDQTAEVLNQPTNVAFEPNGTRLFFANLGGAHVGAFDVGERGAPLCYPKL
jgi:gluconolactonase